MDKDKKKKVFIVIGLVVSELFTGLLFSIVTFIYIICGYAAIDGGAYHPFVIKFFPFFIFILLFLLLIIPLSPAIITIIKKIKEKRSM